jgi:hypothetical protein
MIGLRWALVLSVSVSACRTPLLPSVTMGVPAPRCGAHPIAPSAGRGELTYFACQVDVAARSPNDRFVKYPEMLARANVEGTVELQFVVDGHGGVDSTTIVVLQSPHAFRSGGLEPRGHVSHRVRVVPAFRPR